MQNIYDIFPKFYKISRNSKKKYIIISIDYKNNKVYYVFDNKYILYKNLTYYETIIAV